MSVTQASRGAINKLRARMQTVSRGTDHDYEAGQEATILTLVSLAAIAVVGTLIVSEIGTALPDPTNSSLNTSFHDLLTGFGDAMGLVPVVFIVLVAALIIGVVSNFR